MRHQGRRLPWSEIDHGPVFKGELRTVVAHGGGDRPIMASLLSRDGLAKSMVADLHEPVFAGVGQDVFHLRGIERLTLEDGVHAVVQEWRCTPIR
jgi:hypothetical protein